MKIFPQCSIKTLAECEPGQIVREIGYGGERRFALASDVVDSPDRALILLGEGGPEYKIFKNPKDCGVLCLSGEPIWEIDQFGPFEPRPRELYDQNGIVIRFADKWTMNVRAYSSQIRRGQGIYDFENGKLIDPSHEWPNSAIFGAWRLCLHDEGRPYSERIEIARFPHQVTKAGSE